MSVYDERVKLGAQLLDVSYPGWETSIDLNILNQGDMERCVLGQFFGHYTSGLDRLDLMAQPDWLFGFSASPKVGGAASYLYENYELFRLTRAWKRYIKAKRNMQ